MVIVTYISMRFIETIGYHPKLWKIICKFHQNWFRIEKVDIAHMIKCKQVIKHILLQCLRKHRKMKDSISMSYLRRI